MVKRKRLVRILKNALHQAKIKGEDSTKYLARYLLTYRNTPHSTTGETPAMLMFGRNLRTRLDLLIPSANTAIHKSQSKVIDRTESRGCRNFAIGDTVLAKNFYHIGGKWLYGTIVEVLGNKHYTVKVKFGDVMYKWKRHIDQLLPASTRVEDNENVNVELPQSNAPIVNGPEIHGTGGQDKVVCDETLNKDVMTKESETVPVVEMDCGMQSEVNSQNEKRYPTRARKSPSYLKDYET